MKDVLRHQNLKPVVKGASYFLTHVPSMIRNGSKSSREVSKDPSILAPILTHLESFVQAVAYPQNQVLIGEIIYRKENDQGCKPVSVLSNLIGSSKKVIKGNRFLQNWV
jgi:hypothetical protein